MKKSFSILAILAALAVSSVAQTPPAKSAIASPPASIGSEITATRALGDVAGIDVSNKHITLHTNEGDLSVQLSDATKYKRVAPDAKSLESAQTITLADISVGDRIIAQGKVAADRKSIPARQIIVMSKTALAEKREHDRAEWNRRGISGRVTNINLETKEITITARALDGQRTTIIPVNDKVTFRRYAPDSVKFSDAKPSSLAELKIGDQLRALGERSPDGARFTPQEIVSGSFRMVGGNVTAVNAATNEIQINNLQTGQPLTIVVNKDSMLRRIPPELAMAIAMRGQARGGGAAAPGGAGNNAGAAGGSAQAAPASPGGADTAPAAVAGRRGGFGAGRPDGGGGGFPGGNGERPRFGGGGGGDIQERLERLPAVAVTDLKPGDAVLVLSTTGADPARATAITLATGVEALLRPPAGVPGRNGGRSANQNAGGLGNVDDVFGGGIGLP
jgi:Cu/Ag efflux protein CusF